MKILAAVLSLAAVAAVGWFGAGVILTASPTSSIKGEVEMWQAKSCACCSGWATYMERNGYKVTNHVLEQDKELEAIKDKFAIPEKARSCHTATVKGYVVEGHVPLEAIEKFLSAPVSGATGIAAPGMPSGSPGMNGPKEPNPIITFGAGPSRDVGTY